MNVLVKMFKYVIKGIFDVYNWGLVENKQKFIGQIMIFKSFVCFVEDVDVIVFFYVEVKVFVIGDDCICEKMDLDVQVFKLKMFKVNYIF